MFLLLYFSVVPIAFVFTAVLTRDRIGYKDVFEYKMSMLEWIISCILFALMWPIIIVFLSISVVRTVGGWVCSF